jgi:uncharacterized protein YbaP (TraB family)
MKILYGRSLIVFVLFVLIIHPFGQAQEGQKYQSLFWKITGNGLAKPCYLYGSMHVSDKVAFHLSDDFFIALKSCDMIALEENPENFTRLMQYQYDLIPDELNVQSMYGSSSGYKEGFYGTAFPMKAPDRYDLMKAMKDDAGIINHLLYRFNSYYRGNSEDDFSGNFAENTYLDLFVFQAARKNNKPVINLENYKKTFELLIQGSIPDKDEDKNSDYSYDDGLEEYSYGDKLDDAYLRGDLDLVDSIEKKMSSKKFHKYFIEERNKIMAQRMDSIMKSGTALFTTVGCAHLPGEMGVIELLRSKGYTVEPIKKFLISKKSSYMKTIENQRVKNTYKGWQPADNSFQVSVPGDMYAYPMTIGNRQYVYPDMVNGAYYYISRIPTAQFLSGHSTEYQFLQLDSVIYQGIPGDILSKKEIEKNGVRGYDIENKTKRGDYQRYQIYITPLEVVVFKMGGTGTYVKDESNEFFNSIKFNSDNKCDSKQFGFHTEANGYITQTDKIVKGHLKTRLNNVLESYDTSGYYLVMRTSYNDESYIEEDVFELNMLAQNFIKDRNFKVIDSTLSYETQRPVLKMNLKNDKGQYLHLKILYQGPSYYLLAAVDTKETRPEKFFNSFTTAPASYLPWTSYNDTSMFFTVQIPEVSRPKTMDLKGMYYGIFSDYGDNEKSKDYNALDLDKTFRYLPTDEAISVSYHRFHKYTSFPDIESLWKKIIAEKSFESEGGDNFMDALLSMMGGDILSGNTEEPTFKLVNKKQSKQGNSDVLEFLLTDSLSTRAIKVKSILKQGALYTLRTCIDTTVAHTEFVQKFYDSFIPDDTLIGSSLFENKTSIFFANLNQQDTTLVREALESINKMNLKAKDLPEIKKVLKNFDFKKYKNSYKIDFLNALYDIKNDSILPLLEEIYTGAGDTATLKLNVLENMSNIKTQQSFNLIKKLLLEDTPFDKNSYSLNTVFYNLRDSLTLAATLFPDLLKLTRYEDYRQPVYNLLSDLVDSSLIKTDLIKTHIEDIYADGNNELKRTIADENDFSENINDYNGNYYSGSDLYAYASILLPFAGESKYKTYIEKVRTTKDKGLRMLIDILMLSKNMSIPDTAINSYAKDIEFRSDIYERLERIHKLNLFSDTYKNQLSMAQSLFSDYEYNPKNDTLVFLCKRYIKSASDTGYIYFFKIADKEKKKWKLAYSGCQPEDTTKISVDGAFVDVTYDPVPERQEKLDKKINEMMHTFMLVNRKRAGSVDKSYGYDY